MMRYSAAELACENDGAKLASVHSPNDLATIQYYLDRNRLAFWIGLKKVGGSTYCVNHDCNGMLRYDTGTLRTLITTEWNNGIWHDGRFSAKASDSPSGTQQLSF